MSPKHNTTASTGIDHHCQHINGRGHRCRMLIDKGHPSLCPYHLAQSNAKGAVPDPEILAAELLGEIVNFTTADAVNLFLGNLVKQLARKRIARRDAIALAYLCQLLLNSLTPLWKEIEDEQDAHAYLINSRRQAAALDVNENNSPEGTRQ